MRSKITRILLLLALALGALTACGQGEGGTSAPGASPMDDTMASPEASPGDMMSPEASPSP